MLVWGERGWVPVEAPDIEVNAWLGAANGSFRSAWRLHNVAARSREEIPEGLRLTNLSDAALERMWERGGDDRWAAAYEWIRRYEGIDLRYHQLDGVEALLDEKWINMMPSEGKSAVLRDWAAIKAGHGDDAVQVIEPRATLAGREFRDYEKVLKSDGFDIVRGNRHGEVPTPEAGSAQSYIVTHLDAVFSGLRGKPIPGRHAGIDESDELFRMDTTYKIVEGETGPARPEVAERVEWARDVVAEHLVDAKGSPIEDYFHRSPGGRYGDHMALRGPGRDKVEEVLGRPLSDAERVELNRAATARNYQKGTHYAVRQDRIIIIDQFSHLPMVEWDETGRIVGESRWEELAPALEAKERLTIREEAKASKSTTAKEFFSKKNYDTVVGVSGTNKGNEELFKREGLPHEIVDIPSFFKSKQNVLPDILVADNPAKVAYFANAMKMLRDSEGGLHPPQAIYCHDNALVGKGSKLLDDLEVTHTAIDVDWVLDQRANWEEALQKVTDGACELGSIMVFNMTPARGTHIPVREEVARTFPKVWGTERSALTRDIDIQFMRRFGRQGQHAEVQILTAPDDPVFVESANSNVKLTHIRYTDAVKADHANSTQQTRAAVDQAARGLRALVPYLQGVAGVSAGPAHQAQVKQVVGGLASQFTALAAAHLDAVPTEQRQLVQQGAQEDFVAMGRDWATRAFVDNAVEPVWVITELGMWADLAGRLPALSGHLVGLHTGTTEAPQPQPHRVAVAAVAGWAGGGWTANRAGAGRRLRCQCAAARCRVHGQRCRQNP